MPLLANARRLAPFAVPTARFRRTQSIGPARQRIVGVAAPAWLLAHGTPEHPRDVHGQACIRHMFSSGRRSVLTLQRGQEVFKITPDGRLASESADVQIGGPVAGLGILFTFEELVADALADGRLVRVLDGWQEEFNGPKLYYSSRRQMPAPLRAFVDFLKTSASALAPSARALA